MMVSRIILVAAIAVTSFDASFAQQSTGPNTFQAPDKVELPVGSLSKGEHTIRLVDRLTDRMVVEIDPGSSNPETFLAVPAPQNFESLPAGPIFFKGTKEKQALRGFKFGSGPVVEFAFPKTEAVALAKANDSSVVAVDPASEGMPDLKGLSSSDRRMISLWLLTPTKVGDQPGISAAKYTPPVAPAQPTVVASNETPAVPSAPVQATAPVTPRVRKAPIQKLPKTASLMPLAVLSSFSLLCLGGVLSFYRLRETKS